LTEEQRSIAASYEIARQQNARNLDKAVLMIELRKWCVVQAVTAGAGENSDVFAEKLLRFVSAPLQE
jgi:hypothetical protein